MHKYAIVVSEFNQKITDLLLKGAQAEFEKEKISKDDIEIFKVPGAIEIPLTAQLLAKTKKYNAILGLGAVIRGDTDHYDYVCQQVSYGCQRVMLDQDIPVIFGVLTTENFEQALARVGGPKGHKGKDAARAALQMTKMISKICT